MANSASFDSPPSLRNVPKYHKMLQLLSMMHIIDSRCAARISGSRLEEVFLTADRRSDGESGLRVRDLLREVGFGLEAAGGVRGLDAPIKGIHLSELGDPTPWMLPHSILLTTGLRLQEHPESGARLLRTLSDASMAALVVALGHTIAVPPQCMVEEADRLGFPLLLAPFDLPFQRIVAFVYDARRSDDTYEEMYRLKRTISIQDHLVDLLTRDHGLERFLEAVSDLLKATVLLFDASGDLASVTGPTVIVNAETADAYFRGYLEVKRRPERSPNFLVGGYATAYREVLVSDRLAQVLLAVRNGDDPLPELGNVTLFYAQKLLSLHKLGEQGLMLLREDLRSAFLDDLLNGAATEAEFTLRMRRFGLDPESEWRLAICAIRDRHSAPQAKQGSEEEGALGGSLRAVVDAFIRARQLTCLTTTQKDFIAVLMVPLEEDPERVFELSAELCQTAAETMEVAVDVGVSAAGRGALRVGRGFAEAQECLHVARSCGSVAGAAVFENLVPQRRLVANQSVESLQAVIAQTLGQLLLYDAAHRTRLLATIRAYIDSGCHVGNTARVLYIHRNTLRQRIDRAEQLTGAKLDNSNDVVDLVLGFRALDHLQYHGCVELLPDRGDSPPVGALRTRSALRLAQDPHQLIPSWLKDSVPQLE